jgi:hypothetical protein
VGIRDDSACFASHTVFAWWLTEFILSDKFQFTGLWAVFHIYTYNNFIVLGILFYLVSGINLREQFLEVKIPKRRSTGFLIQSENSSWFRGL